jgi:hypothetical protein
MSVGVAWEVGRVREKEKDLTWIWKRKWFDLYSFHIFLKVTFSIPNGLVCFQYVACRKVNFTLTKVNMAQMALNLAWFAKI